MDSRTCHRCASLFTTAEIREAILSEKGYRLEATRRSLEQSASSGCPLCTQLVDRDLSYFNPSERAYGYTRWISSFPERPQNPNENEEVVFHVTALTGSESKLEISGLKNVQLTGAIGFLVLSSLDDPAHVLFSQLPANLDVGSSRAFATARKWLSECSANEQGHEGCQKPHSVLLPTRVLDVTPMGRGHDPKLHVASEQEHGEYAALSYCWGGPQLHATTNATIGSYMDAIPRATIPATILDALRVTVEIGIKYLWVDSYCIIQDSDNDKEKELGRMDEIYRDALVTISAASSSHCGQGFLENRDCTTQENSFVLPFQDEHGRKGYITLVDEEALADDDANEPVNDRAWILQESLLSPRRLHYGADQLSWICRSKFIPDGGPMTWMQFQERARISSIMSGIPDSELAQFFPGTFSLPIQGHTTTARRQWQMIVSDYTSRSITNPMDKLPAISAVARHVSRSFRCDYLAGLWRSHLLLDLLWLRGDETESSRPLSCWRAPSWSWASIDGQAIFEDVTMNQFTPSAEIVSAYVKPAREEFLFSVITDGVLEIRGFLRRVEHCVRASDLEYTNLLYPYEEKQLRHGNLQGNTSLCGIFLDASASLYSLSSPSSMANLDDEREDLEIDEKTPMWCLTIGLSSNGQQDENSSSVRKAHGAVLSEAKNGSYQRIGYFEGNAVVDTSGWFESGEQKTVTVL